MNDIFHTFPINTSPAKVFEAVSSPAGLDAWWTEKSTGTPATGNEYRLSFGPGYDWRATVRKCVPGEVFEFEIVRSDNDWNGTRVGFVLTKKNGTTQVEFYHIGWPEQNEHYRISSFCWAMYLRLLKRYLEFGESVPYNKRLDA